MFLARNIDAFTKINQANNIDDIICFLPQFKKILDSYIYETYYKFKPTKDDIAKYKKPLNENWASIKSKKYVIAAIDICNRDFAILETKKNQGTQYAISFCNGQMRDNFSYLSLTVMKTIELGITNRRQDKDFYCAFSEIKKIFLDWINIETNYSENKHNIHMI